MSAKLDKAFEGRERWLQRVRNASNNPNAKEFWRSLPDAYKVDKEFVLVAIKHFQTLPDKHEFERLLPQSLRFDPDVALAFCGRPDFECLYDARHLYPPPCLVNVKEVMLAYCLKVPQSLQECSRDKLADDRDVVEAAVAKDGLALQYASIRLQGDPDLVRKACESNFRALDLVPPGSMRTHLLQDRQFVMDMVRQDDAGPVLQMASVPLRSDRQLVLEALTNGMLLRFCPSVYQEDQGFLCDALERKPELYLEMKSALQLDPAVARAAVTSLASTTEVLVRALDTVPALLESRDIVLVIIKKPADVVVDDMLVRVFGRLDDRFRDDEEIALVVLKRAPSLFSMLSSRLQRDEDFLVALMNKIEPNTFLGSLSAEIQAANPHVPALAIKLAEEPALDRVRAAVRPDSLWGNKQIAIEWIRRGQPLKPTFKPLMKDPDVALAIVQFSRSWKFSHVDLSLRSDVNFMRQALALNGRVLRYAAPEMHASYPLVVLAVATTPGSLWPGSPISEQQVFDYLSDKLRLHEAFMAFLFGVTIRFDGSSRRHSDSSASDRSGSALPLLDRGVETSQALKRRIAEFLGAPLGRDLDIARRARENLSIPPTAEGDFFPHDDVGAGDDDMEVEVGDDGVGVDNVEV